MPVDGLSSALAVLTAMITPAVLISACGTLILSTTTRAGRVVDRVRELAAQFEALASAEQPPDLLPERRTFTFQVLDTLTRRAKLLQRSITLFYLALGVFVFTSVAIGVVTLTNVSPWLPVVMALVGAAFLSYGSLLLVVEARLAFEVNRREMDFLMMLGEHYAPAELVEERRASRQLFRRSGGGRVSAGATPGSAPNKT